MYSSPCRYSHPLRNCCHNVGVGVCVEDRELVNEVLEDISRHEEDYLDLTLEEESELIATMKSYLSRGATHTV